MSYQQFKIKIYGHKYIYASSLEEAHILVNKELETCHNSFNLKTTGVFDMTTNLEKTI